ncbi:MAG: hypothetical protein U0T74_13495 [Chitinophagales bacterium]
MTDQNIDHLISAILLIGFFYIFMGVFPKSLQSLSSSTNSQTQNTNTPAEKSIWDKLKIVSLVISAIAALIFAIVKAVALF